MAFRLGVPKVPTARKLPVRLAFAVIAEIAELFPVNQHKQVRNLQQALADLVRSQGHDDLNKAAIASHYASLIRALAHPASYVAPPPDPAPSQEDHAEHRARKQAGLAAEALRQVVLEAVETPLAMFPSLLADTSLSDHDKLSRIRVYSAALEMLYEPLQLETIGNPGDSTVFDPSLHESAMDLSPGQTCTIRRIGFQRGDAVIRIAVVDAKE